MITLTYIHNTDTYYFPNKEMYIKRWMFLWADPDYLGQVLGLDFMHTQDRDSLFVLLGQDNENRPDHYRIEYPE